MVTKISAERIYGEVRDFYKGNLKSDNKEYDLNDKTFAELSKKIGEKRALERITTRNDNQKTVLGQLERLRRDYPTYDIEKGKPSVLRLSATAEIIARQPNGRVGNCGEMAILACHYAAKKGIKNAWVARVSRPGDHEFCLLDPPATPPAWNSLEEMTSAIGDNATCWVVDPWAGTCCKAGCYCEQFCQKMGIWTQQGKRIRLPDSSWTDPNNNGYLKDFYTSTLEYQQFT
jgi:hypothetical protein